MARYCGLALLTLVLVGCGGGGGTPDTTPPGIVSYNPGAGATLVDQDSPVDVIFNEALNHASVNSGTFALRRADDTLVAGTYEITDDAYLYSGTAVRFIPAERLDDDALYHVAISTGITDLAGNHLSAPLSWSFTTMPAGLGAWTPTTLINAAPASVFHTAVWTGSEMLVWGGIGLGSQGYRYDPGANSWAPMSATGAPSPRTGHSAVWTGTELIIWGGVANGTVYQWLDDGARYDPATDTWHSLGTSNTPAARAGHSAVWTGSRMLVWGGRSGDFAPTYPPSGARYDPATDSWTAMGTTDAPAGRTGQTAIWTGNAMVIWGGIRTQIPYDYFLSSGGRYDPATDSWSATSDADAPAPRAWHSAVWSGGEMIVWGGFGGVFANETALGSGARYDPVADTWTPTAATAAPTPRWGHRAVWTGSRMIVWGGDTYSRLGGQYDPANDAWFYTSTLSAPLGRMDHTAVWTGSRMIVWGGSNGVPLDTGALYTP